MLWYLFLSNNIQCQISEIFDDGAYVELLEYNRIKGMLLSSELSRKRVNYVKRLIKEGREEVLRVLRIDPQKGFFDLSKKSVKIEEIEEDLMRKIRCLDKLVDELSKGKTVTKIKEKYAGHK